MRVRRDFDSLILITTILLILIGLSLIYSVFQPSQSEAIEEGSLMFFNRQLVWACFGMIAMLLGFAIPFRYFEALAYVFYAVCLFLLVLPAKQHHRPGRVLDQCCADVPGCGRGGEWRRSRATARHRGSRG